jgi:ABC-type antimicrobial peptide transport system permease subunit
VNSEAIAMALPGPFELLVIAAIFLILVGLPLAIIAIVILLVKRTSNGRHQDNEKQN